jgi:predicted CXXCH cytochrome family protein
VRKTFFLALGVPLLVFAIAFSESIVNSKHNLSSGGPGSITTDETSKVCIFCHTSHNAVNYAPLWNREESSVVYNLYGSSTLYSTPEQPDGATKLCLSCHDGTIALGRTIYPPGDFNMLGAVGNKIPPDSTTNLGSDLSDDHPVSFDPSAAVSAIPELVHPGPTDEVRYDAYGKLQCTACHNPHDEAIPRFLTKSNLNAGLCKTCHQIAGFVQSSPHDRAAKSWNGAGDDPWPHTDYTTVSDNSCMNCHRNHGAGGKERLLNRVEEEVCLVCHNGNLGKNIETLLTKTSSHAVTFYTGHDPAEDILSAPVHVECVDCHNPHKLSSASAAPPNVTGKLFGVLGMTITGSLIDPAQYQYEVCLKCHGQNQYIVTTDMNRMFDTGNIRFAFNPANSSYHAVAAAGKNNWIPSLIPPYSVSSRLYCTDCHNSSDSGPGPGGGGMSPRGPHGSDFEYILERRYETMDNTPFSVNNYALCFKCHDPNVLTTASASGFEKHAEHLNHNVSCAVCHDPHGSPEYIALLNFDRNVVFPSGSGQLRFEVIGGMGYCYLNCHGTDHDPRGYQRK